MDPLVTPEEFSGYMQRDVDRYTAELVLAGASGLVRNYCRWPISRIENDIRVFDGDGSRWLNLPTLKLNDVTSVSVDTGADDPLALTVGTDFRLLPNGMLWRSAGWPIGYANVTIDFDHGYDPVPDEVRIVVCALAAKFYSNPEGLTSRSGGDSNRAFSELSSLEMQLIAGHRLP